MNFSEFPNCCGMSILCYLPYESWDKEDKTNPTYHKSRLKILSDDIKEKSQRRRNVICVINHNQARAGLSKILKDNNYKLLGSCYNNGSGNKLYIYAFLRQKPKPKTKNYSKKGKIYLMRLLPFPSCCGVKILDDFDNVYSSIDERLQPLMNINNNRAYQLETINQLINSFKVKYSDYSISRTIDSLTLLAVLNPNQIKNNWEEALLEYGFIPLVTDFHNSNSQNKLRLYIRPPKIPKGWTIDQTITYTKESIKNRIKESVS